LFQPRINASFTDLKEGEFNLEVQQLIFVFAPEERDVYSYERTPKEIAPLGAKPGGGTFALRQKRLRSYGASE
jgi:hypothetical protein